MRLLLVHLSDIHVRSDADEVLVRAPKIVDAIRNLDNSLDLCVLVFSGDITFSGAESQYEAALGLIELLKHRLASVRPETRIVVLRT